MIMMFRQNARSFPVDIIEAARIDGLSEVRIFFQMFIPTMKSTYHRNCYYLHERIGTLTCGRR